MNLTLKPYASAKGPVLSTCAVAALAGLLSLAAPDAAKAEPSMEESIAFTRSELSRLCDDPRESGIDALDRLQIGGDRSCQVVLAPGRLNFSIRERGSEYSGSGYAKLQLDINFGANSGFLCGRPDASGRAALFFTCDASKGARGAACATREVDVEHPDRDPLQTSQRLAAASILRARPEDCGVLARALTYIGERSPNKAKENLRDFFASR